MHQYMLPGWVTEGVVELGWCTALAFALLYTLKAPWWSTAMGRNLFGLDLAVAFALTPGVLKDWFGVDPTAEWFQWFLVADLLFVSFIVAHRGFLLMRVQPGWNWSARRLASRLRRGKAGHDV